MLVETFTVMVLLVSVVPGAMVGIVIESGETEIDSIGSKVKETSVELW